MEVAGVVLGTLDLVAGAVKKYQELLRITTMSANVVDIRTRVLLERARLETSLQHLSRLRELPQDVASILNETRQSMDMMRGSLLKYTHQQEKPSTKVFGGVQRNRQEMEEHLGRLSMLNKLLEAAYTTQLHLETAQDTINKGVKEPPMMLATDHEAQSSGRGHHPPDKETQDASALKNLATSCSSLLKLRGTDDPLFAELSNQFELWKHGLESERFYQAIKLDSRQNLRHDLVFLLYQTMLYIGETIALSWDPDDQSPVQRHRARESLKEFASISIRVREAVQDLDLPPPTADTGGPKGDQKAKTIQTLTLVINTLRDILPSIVSFSRTCMALQNNIPAAEDVKELLEVSVKLIGPGSKALSRAAEVAKARPDMSTLVDTKLITEAFNRQAAHLEKWAEKHKRDIETKLANESPAKFASVAGTVERIAYFLDKLPDAVDDQLSKASASPKGSLDWPSQETVESVMEGLKTHLQFLDDLEPQLKPLKSLPPYSKSSGDRVVIDKISGEVRPAG